MIAAETFHQLVEERFQRRNSGSAPTELTGEGEAFADRDDRNEWTIGASANLEHLIDAFPGRVVAEEMHEDARVEKQTVAS